MKVRDYLAENFPDALVMDGYDDCIVGICTRFGQEPIVAYDRQKVIAKLVAGGMTEEDAEEWFEFNQIGAWMGDTTPCFIDRLSQGVTCGKAQEKPGPGTRRAGKAPDVVCAGKGGGVKSPRVSVRNSGRRRPRRAPAAVAHR